MKHLLATVFIAVVFVCFVSGASPSYSRHLHKQNSGGHRYVPVRNLDRRYRQAEDSYEEGGEYEYEEEEESVTNGPEDVKNGETEDYYENSEEEANVERETEGPEVSEVEPEAEREVEPEPEENVEEERREDAIETSEREEEHVETVHESSVSAERAREVEEEHEAEEFPESSGRHNEINSEENEVEPTERTEPTEEPEVEEFERERYEETRETIEDRNGEDRDENEERSRVEEDVEPEHETNYDENHNEHENEIDHVEERKSSVEIEEDGREDLDRYTEHEEREETEEQEIPEPEENEREREEVNQVEEQIESLEENEITPTERTEEYPEPIPEREEEEEAEPEEPEVPELTTTTTTTTPPPVPELEEFEEDEDSYDERRESQEEDEREREIPTTTTPAPASYEESETFPEKTETKEEDVGEERETEQRNDLDRHAYTHVDERHEEPSQETFSHRENERRENEEAFEENSGKSEEEEEEREKYEGRNEIGGYSRETTTTTERPVESVRVEDTTGDEDERRGLGNSRQPEEPSDSLEEEDEEEEYYRGPSISLPVPTQHPVLPVETENEITQQVPDVREHYIPEDHRQRGRVEAEEDLKDSLETDIKPSVNVDRGRGSYSDSLEDLSEEEEHETNHINEIPHKIECTTGYQLSTDESECTDVDECSLGFCGASQTCVNLPGSYLCNCPPGFHKDVRNEKNCRDINECLDRNGGCHQDCINTAGSYYCSCSDGFILRDDKRGCLLRTTTTSTTTTTTTTTTTPPPPPPPPPSFTNVFLPPRPSNVGAPSVDRGAGVNNCPTPAVPRGAGIAYLYCSRSPVGIHHRHTEYERRLLQDWASKRNRTALNRNQSNRFRHRRNLKRKLRQTTYSPGSMCELRCRSGFELKGLYNLHCNASDGTWHGVTTGQCQAAPRPSNPLQTTPVKETAPSNEIPRLAPNDLTGVSPPAATNYDVRRPSFPFRPTFVTTTSTTTTTTPQPPTTTTTTTQRPIYYPPPPASRPGIQYPTPARAPTFTPPIVWPKPQPAYRPGTIRQTTTTTTTTTPPSFPVSSPALRPYVPAIPPTQYSYYNKPTTTAAPILPTQSSSKNSFIQLTYRFKTPWIECPDDIKVELPPNQNKAYVIIPQPQTNVDWWRQVSSDPTWAKGLETEIGPGKLQIVFRARTPAPVNNTAECSFNLEVKDSEGPRVRECPESFSTRLSSGQNAKTVTWIEPHFSDNVRIASLKKSHEPGTVMALGEHLVNYEARDASENTARCSFTITVLPPQSYDNGNGARRPVNTEGFSQQHITTLKPEYSSSSLRNVVCHVGKKGRRIMFQSRVVPRGCSEITVDVVDSAGQEKFNTLNTVVQNSAENLATSQISSVSFSSHDYPHSASGFSQAVSNGRNNNRLVHSTSSVTNGAHGTNSRASSYAVAVSSSSRNFELPFLTQHSDKQVYDEDFVVPSNSSPSTRSGDRAPGRHNQQQQQPSYNSGGSNLQITGSRDQGTTESTEKDTTRKYFRHFDSWDTDRTRSRDNAFRIN